MRIVNFPPNCNQIGASGECPHCLCHSYLRPTGNVYTEADPRNSSIQRSCNPGQCESCKGFVLVVGKRNTAASKEYSLEAVYPLGKPNEDVEPSVPEEIAADFREALRCQWIKAFKATVAMCGRAIQASVISLGAKGDRLIDQIDNLASQGRITTPLKEMAHEVRLTRNVGAHPDKDGLKDVGEKDADDIVEFTREYLHHVYVMPAKLEARRRKLETSNPN